MLSLKEHTKLNIKYEDRNLTFIMDQFDLLTRDVEIVSLTESYSKYCRAKMRSRDPLTTVKQ